MKTLGRITIAFACSRAGKYAFSIALHRQELQSSPMMFEMVEDAIDPTQCRVDGPSLNFGANFRLVSMIDFLSPQK
jgi:hypothetical protein